MVVIGTLIVMGALLAASPASAHAFLQHASPPAGAELRVAPAAVTIAFTATVEPRFSTIEVRDAAGARVDTGSPRVEGKATTLAVSLTSLPPGTYTVIWRATSVDTHRTEGQYTFSVLP